MVNTKSPYETISSRVREIVHDMQNPNPVADLPVEPKPPRVFKNRYPLAPPASSDEPKPKPAPRKKTETKSRKEPKKSRKESKKSRKEPKKSMTKGKSKKSKAKK